MKNANLLLIIIIVGIVLSSCGPTTESPSMDESPIKSVTETPPTIGESPKRPAADVSPTTEGVAVNPDEHQGIPDKPLSTDGPWWIFSVPEGLYAINPDGSGLTQFHYGPINSPWARKILVSPSGGHLAYLVGESYDATLKINKFPWHTLITETPLLSNNSEPDMDAMRAIVEFQSLAFSPDGRFLAFMGAIDGPTSDLYLFSLDSFETTQLTDGPSQAYQPVWSPDGKYIVHTGASTFGSGAGSTITGIWASVVENADAISLYDPSGSGSEKIIGWVDNQTFVVHSWDAVCGMNNLRLFNIETKENTLLWGESFRSIAFDQSSAVVLLSSNDGECSPDGGAGIFIVPTDGNAPYRIVEDTGHQIIWSQDANLFLVSGEFGPLAVDSRGQFIDLDMPQGVQVFPAVAPGSRDLAWLGESLWIGPLLGSIENPPEKIFNEPVYTVTWTPDGQSVIFFAESGLYIAHQPDYTPILIAEGLDNRNGYSGWLLP